MPWWVHLLAGTLLFIGGAGIAVLHGAPWYALMNLTAAGIMLFAAGVQLGGRLSKEGRDQALRRLGGGDRKGRWPGPPPSAP